MRLGVSGTGQLAHLSQDDLLAELRQLVNLVATSLVKLDISRDKRIRGQFKAFDVWMPLLDCL